VGDERVELGNALAARAAAVADAVADRVWPRGTDGVDPAAVETIKQADRAATLMIADWLTGGEHMDEGQRQALAELGALVDRVCLGDLTKAYLAWRDTLLAAVDEEAARLGTPAELIGEVQAVVSRNNDGSIVRMARRFDEERRRLHQELDAERAKLAEQARHDPLTGLPNRTLLFERLQQALAVAMRRGNPVAILFIDLDGFKHVNDRLGHHAGDELLVAVADRLEDAVRRIDTVARLGGDEFVVLCEDLDTDERPIEIANRVIAAIERPIIAGGEELAISASVGVAHSTGADEPSGLLKRADAAMYAAKQRGPGRHQLATA
jgi:diguanylate cyclase (GGDEF)-like protein